MKTPYRPNPTKRARCQLLRDYLDTVRLTPLPTDADVDELLAELPQRKPKESLSAWLDRAYLSQLAEFYRRAAASDIEKYPLPEKPMRSSNGQFELTINKYDDKLELCLKALGPTRYQYRSREVFLALMEDSENQCINISLNEQGIGTVFVHENQTVRKILAHPHLFAVSNHAR